MSALIDRIVALSGPLPNAGRFRHWLEGQKKAALDARLQQLERENEEPYTDRPLARSMRLPDHADARATPGI